MARWLPPGSRAKMPTSCFGAAWLKVLSLGFRVSVRVQGLRGVSSMACGLGFRGPPEPVTLNKTQSIKLSFRSPRLRAQPPVKQHGALSLRFFLDCSSL